MVDRRGQPERRELCGQLGDRPRQPEQMGALRRRELLARVRQRRARRRRAPRTAAAARPAAGRGHRRRAAPRRARSHAPAPRRRAPSMRSHRSRSSSPSRRLRIVGPPSRCSIHSSAGSSASTGSTCSGSIRCSTPRQRRLVAERGQVGLEEDVAGARRRPQHRRPRPDLHLLGRPVRLEPRAGELGRDPRLGPRPPARPRPRQLRERRGH